MKELTFLNLNDQTYLNSETEDTVSDQIDIVGGFPFGSINYTTVYVCGNYINFQRFKALFLCRFLPTEYCPFNDHFHITLLTCFLNQASIMVL